MENIWGKFFQRSLSSLTHLTLTIYNEYRLYSFTDQKKIKSFQTIFWTNEINLDLYQLMDDHNKCINCHFYYYSFVDPYNKERRLNDIYRNGLICSLLYVADLKFNHCSTD